MALLDSSKSSFLAATLAVILFAGMQMYKTQIASNEYMTIVGGFLGSLLFSLLLTAVSNFEATMFGRNFQTQFFPEVVMCLFTAMFASAFVHRVCVTTCFLFSMLHLYYINKVSSTTYMPSAAPAPPVKSGKKKN